MALRDTLIEFEAMHYREAVTRINRYRENLRRPLATRARVMKVTQQGRSRISEERVKRNDTKESITEERKGINLPNSSPPGIRMSPSKEWKPYVSGNSDHNTGDNPGRKATSPKKSKAKSDTIQVQKVKNHHTSRASIPSKLMSMNPTPEQMEEHPIYGENHLNQKISINAENKTNWNRYAKTTRETQTITETLQLKATDNRRSDKLKNVRTKAVFVDLRERLNCEPQRRIITRNKENKKVVPRDFDALSAKTALGAKLRLLLQKSSHSQRCNPSSVSPVQNIPTLLREKMPPTLTQLTRPLAIQSSVIQFPITTKLEDFTKTHVEDEDQILTQNGVKEGKPPKTAPSLDINKKLTRPIVEAGSIQKHRYKAQQGKTYNIRKLKTAGNVTNTRAGLNGISVSKLLIQPTDFHTSKDGDVSATRSINPWPLNEGGIATKNRKKANQEKILRVGLMGPSKNDGVWKNQLLQQRTEQVMQARHMFGPGKLAITSLTAAILNSELSLRAPSSSPVDFLKNFQPGSTSKVAVTDQEILHLQGLQLSHNLLNTHQGRREGLPLNVSDGLSSTSCQSSSQFKRNLQMPRVSDLVDLQRLYDEMRRHIGTAPFQMLGSTVGSRQNTQGQHLDKVTLKKQAFYHYPYPYQNTNIHQGVGVPLYIVTGAKKVHDQSQKQKPESDAFKYDQRRRKNEAMENHKRPERISESTIVYHTPFPQSQKANSYQSRNNNLNIYEQYQGYSGIRGVTVSVMKAPLKSVQFEQTKEQ